MTLRKDSRQYGDLFRVYFVLSWGRVGCVNAIALRSHSMLIKNLS